MEAELRIKIDDKFKQIFKNIDFSELCITSKAEITYDKAAELEVITKKMRGKKCSVCWKISPETCTRHPE